MVAYVACFCVAAIGLFYESSSLWRNNRRIFPALPQWMVRSVVHWFWLCCFWWHWTFLPCLLCKECHLALGKLVSHGGNVVIPFFLCIAESKRIWCPTPTLQYSTMLIFGCVHRGAIFHWFALRRLELCACIQEWDLQRWRGEDRSSGSVRFWMWCRECYLNSCIIRRDILLFLLLPNQSTSSDARACRALTDDSSCGPDGHGCLLSAKVPSRHCYKR